MVNFESLYFEYFFNGHEFEQTPGDREGQGSLACCSQGSQRVRHSWAAEQQQTIGLGKIFPMFSCCSHIGLWPFPVNSFCLVYEFSSIKSNTTFPLLFLLTKMLTKCRYLGSLWFILTHLHCEFCEDIMSPSFTINALWVSVCFTI